MSEFTNLLSYMYPNFKNNLFIFKLWDVGHGLSIWIKTPNGQNHWIDLGKTDNFSPTEHVKKMYNVNNIDFLIISHTDKDHLEDITNFLNNFGEPSVILRNKSLPEKDKYGELNFDYQREFKKIDTLFTKSVEWNKSPANPENNGGIEYLNCMNTYSENIKGNNTSVVVMFLYKDLLIVCPGDIEPKGWIVLWENNMIKFENLIKRAETRVLIAPHHGRKSGYSQNMIHTIKPHLVIISDVWGDSETQPDYRTKPLGILQNGQNIQYFSTKRNGRVEITETNYGGFEYHQYE